MLFRFSSLTMMLIMVSVVWTQRANAQYIQADKVLTAGQSISVTAPDADTLLVTYRPGSNIAETQVILLKGATYEWTPRQAGIVSLSTPGGVSQTVSVRFNSFPFPGFIVLVVAGCILFGGALYASVNLFGKPSSRMVTDRPDT